MYPFFKEHFNGIYIFPVYCMNVATSLDMCSIGQFLYNGH